LTDIEAGKAVGCITILVGNLKCDLCRLLDEKNIKPDYITASLLEASKLIEGQKNGNLSRHSKP
jgi:ribonucleotide monophosphatase NagD (HAD superfamily)